MPARTRAISSAVRRRFQLVMWAALSRRTESGRLASAGLEASDVDAHEFLHPVGPDHTQALEHVAETVDRRARDVLEPHEHPLRLVPLAMAGDRLGLDVPEQDRLVDDVVLTLGVRP